MWLKIIQFLRKIMKLDTIFLVLILLIQPIKAATVVLIQERDKNIQKQEQKKELGLNGYLQAVVLW